VIFCVTKTIERKPVEIEPHIAILIDVVGRLDIISYEVARPGGHNGTTR
jgi:hypothetical protein